MRTRCALTSRAPASNDDVYGSADGTGWLVKDVSKYANNLLDKLESHDKLGLRLVPASGEKPGAWGLTLTFQGPKEGAMKRSKMKIAPDELLKTKGQKKSSG